MFHFGSNSYDIYEDDSFSDENDVTSSEDEIDIILHGTPEQHRKLEHVHRRQQHGTQVKHGQQAGRFDADSSSEDEFEKEMNDELSQQVKVLEDSRGKLALTGNKQLALSQDTERTKDIKQAQSSTSENQFYDEVYFDSDEEEDTDNAASRKQKRAMMSNDDLLYDPGMDDEDQKWVDRQRQSHHIPAVGATGKRKKAKMPNSDAMLDCPACMTTVCLDCQRHETYKYQYRAMFVMNCTTDKSETLQCPEQAQKKKKKPKKKEQETAEHPSSENPSADLFHPVRCTECNTVVGVVDHDEVYHFFNVLASHT